ncbi:MAG: hypothetical protein NZ930_00965 [Candidatus Bipolaricaulota bacterium]|nr:hypothetical protein [Candidatus Bipolaricaulota bacterium]MDW8031274.1 hypothetical protein [Candidatus Bipolaricaulota bacterium]
MRALLNIFLMVTVFGGMALAQGVNICDYTPPRNELFAIGLSGDYRYFNDRYLDNRSNVSVGHLAMQGVSWLAEPEWGYRIEGIARLELGQALRFDIAVASSADVRRYLDENLFLFGGLASTGVPGQPDLAVTLLGGAGWGRFRDVTPLAKAIKVSEALQQEKIIPQPLSSDQLQQIAQIIGRRAELGLSGVLEEIEKALGTTLGVRGVLALQSVLIDESRRFCGFDLTASVGYEVLDPTGTNSAVVQVAANLARALDADSGLLANALWQADLPFTGYARLTASASYTRLLSPTATLTALYGFSGRQSPGRMTQLHTITINLNFLVSTALSLLMRVETSWGSGFEEPSWGLSAGFTYTLY